LISDCGTNILLRAQLASLVEAGEEDFPETESEFERAAAEFRRALELDSAHAPAWCGLVCAVSNNPMLAQHAFCHSLELETLAPDPYANLSFIFTAQLATSASDGVSATLTQVADVSPKSATKSSHHPDAHCHAWLYFFRRR
jgi:hypothetical protein